LPVAEKRLAFVWIIRQPPTVACPSLRKVLLEPVSKFLLKSLLFGRIGEIHVRMGVAPGGKTSGWISQHPLVMVRNGVRKRRIVDD
jgi:hypothetical protein